MALPEIDQSRIKHNDPPKIIWMKVQDAAALIWDENPKQHDIGALAASIQKYGFQEIPKYDATLKGISSGNGRTECLAMMEKQGQKIPRGIATVEEEGKEVWVMPVMVGTDAESENLAIAYAIDANNLTMAGGDFDAIDFSRMWNPDQYLALIGSLDQSDFPVTVSPDDLITLSKVYEGVSSLQSFKDEEEHDNDPSDFWPIVKLKLSPETKIRFDGLYNNLDGKTDEEKISSLLTELDQ